jgi:hypothetical protein
MSASDGSASRPYQRLGSSAASPHQTNPTIQQSAVLISVAKAENGCINSASGFSRYSRAGSNRQRCEGEEMNFDEEIEKFFKGFPAYQCDRKAIEADVFYQMAVKEKNAVKATERALELMPGYGNVRTMQQQRAKTKKRKKGAFDEFC